jgi:hypothetical protein
MERKEGNNILLFLIAPAGGERQIRPPAPYLYWKIKINKRDNIPNINTKN